MLRALVGLAAAATAFGSLVVGTRAVRRRSLPQLAGPPAVMTDLVAVVAVTLVTAQLLGTVGGLHVVALWVVLVAVGLGTARFFGSGPNSSPAEPSGERVAPRTGGVTAWVAAGVGALLVVEWVPRVVHVFRAGGPLTIDSIWYHLPIAARFAQSGSLLDPVFLSGGALPTYYPHNAELVHALGIVFLGHDTLTPLLNAFWLATALLAAWCIGRPFGAAPLTFTATALVLGGPQLVAYGAGEAINDLFGVAFTLAALAILLNTWQGTARSAGVVYAGLAMGLALGSKYTLAGATLALTIGVIAMARPGERVRTSALWLAPLTVTGSFWYFRNLAATGNPLPPVDVSIGPIHIPGLDVTGVSSVWKVMRRPGAWDQYIEPGLRYALGPVWWATVAFAVTGLLLGWTVRDGRVRLVAFVGTASAAIYIFSPQALGFFGDASFFGVNVRYAAIPLILGAITLALVSVRLGTRVADGAALTFGAALLATQFDDLLWPLGDTRPPELGLPTVSSGELAAGIAIGVVVLVGATVVVLARRGHVRLPTGRAPAARSVAAVSMLTVVGLLVLDRTYVDRRYRDAPFLTRTYAWAQDVEDKRVGLVGTILQYPLTGKNASNHVSYVVKYHDNNLQATALEDCAAWRRELNRRRFDFVVVTSPGYPVGTAPARELDWTRTDKHARLVETDATGDSRAWLFQLTGPLDPLTCGAKTRRQP